jgi:hypothetical protein
VHAQAYEADEALHHMVEAYAEPFYIPDFHGGGVLGNKDGGGLNGDDESKDSSESEGYEEGQGGGIKVSIKVSLCHFSQFFSQLYKQCMEISASCFQHTHIYISTHSHIHVCRVRALAWYTSSHVYCAMFPRRFSLSPWMKS